MSWRCLILFVRHAHKKFPGIPAAIAVNFARPGMLLEQDHLQNVGAPWSAAFLGRLSVMRLNSKEPVVIKDEPAEHVNQRSAFRS